MLQGATEKLICGTDLQNFEIWRKLRLCRAECRVSIKSMSSGMFLDIFMIFYRNKYVLEVWEALDGFELPAAWSHCCVTDLAGFEQISNNSRFTILGVARDHPTPPTHPKHICFDKNHKNINKHSGDMLWMLVRHCARHKRSCLQISNFCKSMTQISLSGAPWGMDLNRF